MVYAFVKNFGDAVTVFNIALEAKWSPRFVSGEYT
jgi:hypothetical protein